MLHCSTNLARDRGNPSFRQNISDDSSSGAAPDGAWTVHPFRCWSDPDP
jgi:hypothetical protein